jgi:hypothetical protein
MAVKALVSTNPITSFLADVMRVVIDDHTDRPRMAVIARLPLSGDCLECTAARSAGKQAALAISRSS